MIEEWRRTEREIGHDFQAVARELPLNGLACAQVCVDVGEPETEDRLLGVADDEKLGWGAGDTSPIAAFRHPPRRAGRGFPPAAGQYPDTHPPGRAYSAPPMPSARPGGSLVGRAPCTGGRQNPKERRRAFPSRTSVLVTRMAWQTSRPILDQSPREGDRTIHLRNCIGRKLPDRECRLLRLVVRPLWQRFSTLPLLFE